MRRSTFILSVLLVGLFLLSGIVTVAQEDVAQKNKQTLLDAIAAYNAGDLDGFYAMLADPFMMNQGDATLVQATHADVLGFDQALIAAVPDVQMIPNVVIAQGDWVAAELTTSGTFTQPYQFAPFGPDSFPPTNGPVSWTGMDFLHFNADGLVSEVWLLSDPTVMFGQLGIFPAQQGDVTGTPVDVPAGYQALSADELAATFTSGMEARNQQQLDGELALPLGDADASMQYYTDPYISWNNGAPYSVTAEDAQGDAAFLDNLKQVMPDAAIEPLDIVVAEGDWVAAIVKLSGTFSADADFFGTPLTHTDQQIEWMFGGIDHYNADGKVVEQWIEGDPSPLLQGLGLMPPMGSE